MSPLRRIVIASSSAALLAAGLAAVPVALPAASAAPMPTRAGLSPSSLVSATVKKAVIDQVLQHIKPGPVSVMLELQAAPASSAYANAERLGARAAGRAARVQVRKVERQATSVTARLSQPATKATVLYTVSRVYSGVAVTTDSSRLSALGRIPGVKAIHPLVPKTRSNFITIPLVHAPESWVATGQTGQGVTVGIIDTGIDYTHADFGGPGTVDAYDSALAAKDAGQSPVYPDPAKVAGGYDFVGNAYDAASPGSDTPVPDDNPLDCGGHGTHVAGTTGGYGVAADGSPYAGPWDSSTPFDTMKIGPGVAPKTTLYALKVFGCEGSTNVVAEALDWAADPNGDGDLSDHLDVVNMSLGSSYGSPDDPDAVASNNAVDVGIDVVASIGNSGDVYEVGGSPGNATKVIGVAASEDNGSINDGISVSVNGSSSVYPASQSQLYDWTTEAGVTDGPVVRIGDWSQAPSDDNDTDGCSPLTPEQEAAVSGKVVVLAWDDNDASRRCGSAGRTDRVAAAGATGAILASTAPSISAGIYGSPAIPAVIVPGVATTALVAALDAGSAVTATLTNALHNSVPLILTGADDPTDEMMDFSSRGLALSDGVKPDVSAPGGTIFSAAVGTGDQGISYSGTSMAAPHTAGVAALVKQAHPTWTPEEIKAGIVNTADHDLFKGPARTGPRYDVLRAGAGRIDAQKAVAAHTVAYAKTSTGIVNVSFGVMNVKKPTTVTRTVRVADKRSSGSAVTYSTSIDMINKLPGATYSVSPTSVSLKPGQSAKLTVTLTVKPAKLRHLADPTLNLDPLDMGLMADFLTDVSGLLKIAPSDGSPTMRLALFAAPRPASAMSGGASVVVSGPNTVRTGTMTLSGTGVATPDDTSYTAQNSQVAAMQLLVTSERLPDCEGDDTVGCIPFEDVSAADLKYVGFTSDAPVVAAQGKDPLAADSTAMGYVGIASWGFWRTPSDIASFLVFMDTNGDGTPDAIMTQQRLSDSADVFASILLDIRDPDPNNWGLIDIELLNNADGSNDTAKFHSNVMMMPFMLATLAHPVDLSTGAELPALISSSSSSISLTVASSSAEVGDVDQVGPVTVNAVRPALTAFDTDASMPMVEGPGDTMKVSLDTATIKGSPQLLLLHFQNVLAKKAQVVSVLRPSTTTLSVSPTSLSKGQRASATVAVTDGTQGGPGGKVEIYDGNKKIASVGIPMGSATVQLPALAKGTHNIQARYPGSSRYAPSRSRTITVTVRG